MNIFYVHENPVIAAQSLVDKHVVKMVLETAQLLSTAHRVIDGVMSVDASSGRKKKVWKLPDDRDDILYSATHINHPSAVWARQSISNYNWLVEHLFALGDEYTYRYGKKHLTMTKLGYELQSPPFKLKEYDWTKMPSCMPDCYKTSDNPVINYRNYYRGDKARMHAWKNRDIPDWIKTV